MVSGQLTHNGFLPRRKGQTEVNGRILKIQLLKNQKHLEKLSLKHHHSLLFNFIILYSNIYFHLVLPNFADYLCSQYPVNFQFQGYQQPILVAGGKL